MYVMFRNFFRRRPSRRVMPTAEDTGVPASEEVESESKKVTRGCLRGFWRRRSRVEPLVVEEGLVTPIFPSGGSAVVSADPRISRADDAEMKNVPKPEADTVLPSILKYSLKATLSCTDLLKIDECRKAAEEKAG